jgi:hypothetical protein
VIERAILMKNRQLRELRVWTARTKKHNKKSRVPLDLTR